LLVGINFTFLPLNLGQVPLKVLERFPEIVKHYLESIQGQYQGLLMLTLGQQLPGPLQLDGCVVGVL
jgi:hypothetical protein